MGVRSYINATNDVEFLRGIIWDTMESVVTAYRMGTKFNIHEDHDGLIYSGIEGVEVSWMNEKIENWVATPRIGKCVEINALWYNALMAMGEMSQLLSRDPYEYQAVAQWIREAFVQTFWSDELGYLYDVVTDESNDSSLRPNQIFALSLPHPLLEGKQAESVLKVVTDELLTPFGLRTLSHKDRRFARALTGGPRSRAGASGIVRKSSSGQFLKPCVEGAWEPFQGCTMVPSLTEIAVSFPEQGISLSCCECTLRNYSKTNS
jgi:predicted glycogen debranching enzyme